MTPGTRLYCIGDIHGRADLLERLLAQIRDDAASIACRKVVVYLGDYVDRGDYSREVLDLLLSGPLPGFEAIHLRGNHEQALLDFLQHPESIPGWLTYGGLATLLSYGVRLSNPPFLADMPEIARQLRERLPAEHIAFLEGLKLYHTEGSYAFVHAGIRPGVELENQHPDDLLWIREDFTRHDGAHPRIMVHGHSVAEQVELRPNRIGLDTGAYRTGILSCLVLEGADQRLLQTGA